MLAGDAAPSVGASLNVCFFEPAITAKGRLRPLTVRATNICFGRIFVIDMVPGQHKLRRE